MPLNSGTSCIDRSFFHVLLYHLHLFGAIDKNRNLSALPTKKLGLFPVTKKTVGVGCFQTAAKRKGRKTTSLSTSIHTPKTGGKRNLLPVFQLFISLPAALLLKGSDCRNFHTKCLEHPKEEGSGKNKAKQRNQSR